MAMFITMKYIDEFADLNTKKGLDEAICAYEECRKDVELADIRVHMEDEVRQFNEDIQKAIRKCEHGSGNN